MKRSFKVLFATAVMVTNFVSTTAVYATEVKELQPNEAVIETTEATEEEEKTISTDNDLSDSKNSENYEEETQTNETETTETQEVETESSQTEETESEEETQKVVSFKLDFSDCVYSKKKLNLKWESVKDAFVYKEFILDGSSWKEIKRTNANVHRTTLKDYGIKYTYRVKAYDADGKVIGISNKAKIMLPKEISVANTTSLSETKVKLSWTKAYGATYYMVYKKTGDSDYKYIKKTTSKNLTISVSKNKKYKFKIVPVYKNANGTIKANSKKISFNNTTDFVSLGHQKYTYSEMVSDMKSMKAKYNDYLDYRVIGKSEQGRNIYDIILGNPDAKKTMLVVCELHAREYVTSVIAMKQIEYYLKNYNNKVDGTKVSSVFNECNVHYVVMANPDGVVISQNSKPRWKSNANNVNLNNNFRYNFKSMRNDDGSYTGKRYESEKETKAIVKITKELKKQKKFAVVNYHAMGNIVFGSYYGNNKFVKNTTKQMYNIAIRTTGYSSAKGYQSTGIGNYREYLMHTEKIPSITIEVGSQSCPVPQSSYASIFNRNKYVLLREAKIFT